MIRDLRVNREKEPLSLRYLYDFMAIPVNVLGNGVLFILFTYSFSLSR